MRRSLWVATALALTSSIALARTVQSHWMGAVKGMDGAATTGTAAMMAGKSVNTTEVTIDLKGETAGITRPWHVHVGSCAKGGGVLGGGRAYTPITIDLKGNGSSTATLAIALPDTGSYYVNVHESSENMGKIVACGDLSSGK